MTHFGQFLGVTGGIAAAVIAWSQYLSSTGRKLKP
jgi:hypothetical protein